MRIVNMLMRWLHLGTPRPTQPRRVDDEVVRRIEGLERRVNIRERDQDRYLNAELEMLRGGKRKRDYRSRP